MTNYAEETANYLTTSDLMQVSATTIILTATGWANGECEAQDAVQALKVAGWQLETAQKALISECRRNGWTWEKIGEWMGVSRQAAQQRFGGSELSEPSK